MYACSPLRLQVSDQLRFNGALLDYAHSLKLSVGLKNLAELIPLKLPDGRTVGSAYDWFLSESCYAYSEWRQGSCVGQVGSI